MPHLRLQVAEEWLTPEFKAASGFDADKLLAKLVETVAACKRPKANDDGLPETEPLIGMSNFKHAIEPLHGSGTAGDLTKKFLHVTLAMGNDTLGRTPAVRTKVSKILGNAMDEFVEPFKLPLASVTVHIQDLDRDRGYSTAVDRKKEREAAAPEPGQ